MNYEVKLFIAPDSPAVEALKDKFPNASTPVATFSITDLSEVPTNGEKISFQVEVESGEGEKLIFVNGKVVSIVKWYQDHTIAGILNSCMIACELNPGSLAVDGEMFWVREGDQLKAML